MPRTLSVSLLAGLGMLATWPAAGQEGGTAPGAHSPDWFDQYLHGTARGIEAVGIAVIVLGAIAASVYLVWQLLRREPPLAAAYHAYRANLGRAILLGLEFLVAADIINTVAFDPTPYSLGILAGIVLIRTFLSFSLEVEIEGRWPWQHGQRTGGADAAAPPRDQT